MAFFRRIPCTGGAMYLAGIGTAVPAQRYSQRECWEALRRAARPELNAPRARSCSACCSATTASSTRHLALDSLDEAFELDPDTLHRRFLDARAALAARAARAALARMPALDARGGRRASSSAPAPATSARASPATCRARSACAPTCFALDLVGQGCGAALPNLRTARGAARLAARASTCSRSASRCAARRCTSTTIPACW